MIKEEMAAKKYSEFFWFDDQLYCEVNDLSAIDKIKDKIRQKVGNSHKYARLLYNLLKPIEPLFSKYSKSHQMGYENSHFMIDFPLEFNSDVYQEFLIRHDGENYTSFIEIVEKIDEFKEGEYEIFYPNGDKFIGRKNKRGFMTGQGKYTWRQGYYYKGDFNLSIPFGFGQYNDCMGNKVTGFFFKGYVLKESYGLHRLFEIYNKKIKKSTKHDLDILLDPTIMKAASKQYIGKEVEYTKLYLDMIE